LNVFEKEQSKLEIYRSLFNILIFFVLILYAYFNLSLRYIQDFLRSIRVGTERYNGWGGRTRTLECRYQKPVPYHLATPQRGLYFRRKGGFFQEVFTFGGPMMFWQAIDRMKNIWSLMLGIFVLN